MAIESKFYQGIGGKNMELASIKFQVDTYFIYENGKVYRNVVAGKFEDKLHCVRKIGKYKLCAVHFDCALPYTVYYLIDTEKEIIYRSEDCHYSYINELVDAIKQL